MADAIDLLTTDHREVDDMFARYQTATDPTVKRELVQSVLHELSKHAAVEEAVFYPAVEKEIPATEGLVAEGREEHQRVKETLAELDGMSPGEPGWDTRVSTLMDEVRHHVKEEEGELFPKVRASMSQPQLDELGAKLESQKKLAPTHPHPSAPNTPPGVNIAGKAAGMLDRVRDKVSGS